MATHEMEYNRYVSPSPGLAQYDSISPLTPPSTASASPASRFPRSSWAPCPTAPRNGRTGCLTKTRPCRSSSMRISGASTPGIRYVFLSCPSLPTLDTQDPPIYPDQQADIYSHGRSEEILGKALQKYNIPRHRVVILSKCFFGVDDQGGQPPISAAGRNDGALVNRVGLSRKHIFDAVEASVQRLGTYIDVLQIHRLDRETPREEIMRALNDVVESGKVRYIGASTVCFPPSYIHPL